MPTARKKPETEQEERQQEKEAQEAGREKEEIQQSGVAPQAGGTAGGASESQQHQVKQDQPESERPLPGSTEAEIPEYDQETARGVNPIAVGATPSMQYDDDAAGKPEDGQDEVDDDEEDEEK